jgi:S-adenosylmethionine synthetase
MSIEAAAGKNPVSHVGKIYNVVAQTIAKTIVAELPDAAHAHCLLVSRIGAPVTHPALVALKVAPRDLGAVPALESRVKDIAHSCLAGIPRLVDDFVAGKIELF